MPETNATEIQMPTKSNCRPQHAPQNNYSETKNKLACHGQSPKYVQTYVQRRTYCTTVMFALEHINTPHGTGSDHITPGHVNGHVSPWPRNLVLVLELAQVIVLSELEPELEMKLEM